MIFKFSNNAESLLASDIGPADVTVAVTAGDGTLFPSPAAGEGFHVLIEQGSKSEWAVCTNRSSDTLTVTRGGAPQSFTAGATVVHGLYHTALNQFLQKGGERTVTTDPDGDLAASYAGEEVYQSVTGVWWKHCTGTTWKEMNL